MKKKLHRRWALQPNMSHLSALQFFPACFELRPSPEKTFNKIDMSGTNSRLSGSTTLQQYVTASALSFPRARQLSGGVSADAGSLYNEAARAPAEGERKKLTRTTIRECEKVPCLPKYGSVEY
jgi:hypothetical protein